MCYTSPRKLAKKFIKKTHSKLPTYLQTLLLNSGWSFHTSNPVKKTSKTNISEAEQEEIKNVIQRADRIQKQEEYRIGRLVEKLENLRKNAKGNGNDFCLLCASKFGVLKTVAKECDTCEKNVCEKCGVDTHNSAGQPIWLCMLCSEQRELWKKTGAWFFKTIPKYSVPRESRSREFGSIPRNRSDTGSSSRHSEDFGRTWTPVTRRSKDTFSGDTSSYTAEDSDDASSEEEMILDRPKRPRASTGSGGSVVSDDFSLYKESMPATGLQTTGTPTERFRPRTGRVTSIDRSIARKKKSSEDGAVDGIFDSQMQVIDGGTDSRHSVGDEEDIDELVRNYKENESQRKDNHSGLGVVEFTLRYQKLDSRLDVILENAQDLKPMDVSGTSDPYVKLHLLPGASKSNKLRSQTKYKTLNPFFDETLTYHGIAEEDISNKTLRLQVYDEDKLGRNDFIGETSVHLKVLNSTPTQKFKRSLLPKAYFDTGRESPENRLGRIQLTLKYNTTRSMLFVGVVRCAGLASMDANGYSDPYVKCYLKPDPSKKSKRRTAIKKKTLNPEFNEEFAYEIPHSELAKKTLEVTVWDYDVGKSNDFIGGVTLHIKAEGQALKHWYETLKYPNQAHTQWHTLEAITAQDD
ncbi:double C2-like domain-containing protein beta isoform X2 [Actinia tenebrosa]|uniref:Double C2-like domain-containing protein beta isoform X2 n=1 Tax=Actinia tenebrosa TaxID=6105 RepID=A0A6P8I312_ACTTE|nr:double C2-like domain-containing protein beta isoform X2 [Actinia tenebrosa]